MDYLPDEMIEHIYSYLTFYDRLSATAVCRRWNRIFEAAVIPETLLKITNLNLKAKKQTLSGVIRRIAQSSRMYFDFAFEGIDFADLDHDVEIQLTVLLANIGLHVQKITLKDCRISFRKLYQSVHLMKLVHTLNIDRCNIYYDDFPEIILNLPLPNLKTIIFHNMRAENEIIIVDLLAVGNLASIKLTIDDTYIDDRTELITRYADRVTFLSCMFYQSHTVRKIFEQPNLNLQTLQLLRKPSDQLNCITLLETLPTQTNLQRLSLNIPISMRVLAELAEFLTLLEFLSVTIRENEAAAPNQINWPKLKVLNLSYRNSVSLLLDRMNFGHLEELHLHTERLTKHTMAIVYVRCPNLKRISLSALSMMRCDTILGSIGLQLSELEAVDVKCSALTTFIPFFISIASLTRLTALTIYFCEKITDHTILHIYLPYLSSFSITRNRKISKVGLEVLFTNCPRIKLLTVCGCAGIDDDAIKTITVCLPHLEYLNISDTMGITLNSVRYIITSLKFLRDLRLENCQRLFTQWRLAPHYISTFTSLRNYHDAYPEFFYYDLPVEPIRTYDSEDCYYYDSGENSSEFDEFSEDDVIGPGEQLVVQPNPSNRLEEVVVLSDDDDT